MILAVLKFFGSMFGFLGDALGALKDLFIFKAGQTSQRSADQAATIKAQQDEAASQTLPNSPADIIKRDEEGTA